MNVIIQVKVVKETEMKYRSSKYKVNINEVKEKNSI